MNSDLLFVGTILLAVLTIFNTRRLIKPPPDSGVITNRKGYASPYRFVYFCTGNNVAVDRFSSGICNSSTIDHGCSSLWIFSRFGGGESPDLDCSFCLNRDLDLLRTV